MDDVFKKLNFKNHESVLAINSPDSFEENLQSVTTETKVVRNHEAIEDIVFLIAFVTKKKEIDALVPEVVPKSKGDAVIWFCYPKGTSKNYTCDFNRDTGWDAMGQYGLEPVRMVAIDKDWSALRFRKVEFIKKITRRKRMALTGEAKRRTSGK